MHRQVAEHRTVAVAQRMVAVANITRLSPE
jgi:hypothetical protein